ncbi:MAG: hypothetical protein H7Y38_07145 [Armatimonadetes bacterium]|nr:hypothetical protein [Armatimonadota bacterium]
MTSPFLRQTPPSPNPPDPAETPRPVFEVVSSPGEAQEHLRVIRQTMERSTKHSTLSGLSGVLVGFYALVGSAVTFFVTPTFAVPYDRYAFIAVWAFVGLLSFTTDVILTKRKAAFLGKTPLSPLGKHLLRAASPGVAVGVILSAFYLMHPNLIMQYIYGVWMLAYAAAILAVGMFSVREVSVLGWAFLGAGAVTLLLPEVAAAGMMAAAFGGGHIWYGAFMGRKFGW